MFVFVEGNNLPKVDWKNISQEEAERYLRIRLSDELRKKLQEISKSSSD